jgi:26S proteasome regulatory subunit N3
VLFFCRTLLHSFRQSVVRGDPECQASLINCILCNYIQFNLYVQADKFASKVTFPENTNINQLARYAYYLGQSFGCVFIHFTCYFLGRINAIQLDYSTAYKYLLQATRKAPQGTMVAAGFQQTVRMCPNGFFNALELGKQACDYSAVVDGRNSGAISFPTTHACPKPLSVSKYRSRQELMHPDSQIHESILLLAVRRGDLDMFQSTLEKYQSAFQRDGNFTMVLRLRHNVIKAGVRLLNIAYFRISFDDVCSKLGLESPADAEFIVAKVIETPIRFYSCHLLDDSRWSD